MFQFYKGEGHKLPETHCTDGYMKIEKELHQEATSSMRGLRRLVRKVRGIAIYGEQLEGAPERT